MNKKTTSGKSRRGFASMDPARQREIAARGGKTAHSNGKAHKWNSAEARLAGKKGGTNSAKARKSKKD
jgi:general stress protein YciG